MSWPKNGALILSLPVLTPNSKVNLLWRNGSYLPMKWHARDGSNGVVIVVTGVDRDQLPVGNAFSIKLENVK